MKTMEEIVRSLTTYELLHQYCLLPYVSYQYCIAARASTVEEEETPAQAKARADASRKINMEAASGLFSRFWQWQNKPFWGEKVE